MILSFHTNFVMFVMNYAALPLIPRADINTKTFTTFQIAFMCIINISWNHIWVCNFVVICIHHIGLYIYHVSVCRKLIKFYYRGFLHLMENLISYDLSKIYGSAVANLVKIISCKEMNVIVKTRFNSLKSLKTHPSP